MKRNEKCIATLYPAKECGCAKIQSSSHMISIHIQGHCPESNAAGAWGCSGVDLWLLDTPPHCDNETHFHSRIWVALWEVEQNHISRPWLANDEMKKQSKHFKIQKISSTDSTAPTIWLQNAMHPIYMHMQGKK